MAANDDRRAVHGVVDGNDHRIVFGVHADPADLLGAQEPVALLGRELPHRRVSVGPRLGIDHVAIWPRVGPEHPVPGLFGGAEGLGRSGPRTLTGHGRTGSPWRHGELTSHRSVCAADV